MNIQPTLEPHYHQEFHFAENTDSEGCCCFWRSKSKPKEYLVEESGVIRPMHGASDKVRSRIIANQRLATLVRRKFEVDPVCNHEAFDKFKARINHDFEGGEKITDEKLIRIINTIYEIKTEYRDENSSRCTPKTSKSEMDAEQSLQSSQ